jgi:hypothetical protein
MGIGTILESPPKTILAATAVSVADSDLFWLAFVAAFLAGLACGWCLRDIRDGWPRRQP